MPRTYRNEINKKYNDNFQILLQTLVEDNGENTEQLIRNFGVANNTSVFIADTNNIVQYSFDIDGIEYEYIIERADTFVTGTLTGVYTHDGEYYYVLAYAKMNEVNQVNEILVKLIPFVLVFIVIISLLGSFIYSRALTRPVIEISRASKKLSGLDLTWAYKNNRTDEIGVLANSLNDMAKKLDTALTDLQFTNRELQNEIKQRSDLFTAISHELKTPITVIRCDLEGMLNNIGRYKDRDAYLEHALNVTENMELLVQEILSVAQIDTDDTALEKTPVDVSPLINECCDDYRELANKKGMELIVSCETGITSMLDRNLIKKALSNIIGNAVNHSPDGEKVEILLQKLNGIAELSVENTGTQIDPADLDKLFQPFYRADKSRSRHTGGSGLGLYIVKTIFERHRLRYTIENTNNGVKFSIMFPLD
jgi:two-component system sensor histidine kinase VanS